MVLRPALQRRIIVTDTTFKLTAVGRRDDCSGYVLGITVTDTTFKLTGSRTTGCGGYVLGTVTDTTIKLTAGDYALDCSG